MHRGYILDCFIIRRKNYQEADKLITVFSRQKGKLTLKAKGIRKLSSRRSASLELFNQVRMQIAKGRGDMDVITEVALEKDYSSLSSQLQRTKIAYELVELVNTFALEQNENIALYELLTKALDFISSEEFDLTLADKTSLRFKLRILELMGYGLHFDYSHSQMNQVIEELMERKLLAHHSFSM